MDTIYDSPEETSGARSRRFWRPKLRRKKDADATNIPRGRPFKREADWRSVALVGAGVAAGVVLGAGIALLIAPQSGAHTRLALSREFRRRRPWRRSPWEQLGKELNRAARMRAGRRRPADVA
ncbi:MAG TPA: hypothetical protein VN602_03005 [Gemmatimonadaceae bacterium]|nr:hypothetical protein [Gemmatimonadaceae bacterium]